MDKQRWQQIKTLFSTVADLAPAERDTFLRQQCDDENVRAEVLALFAAESSHDKGLATVVLGSAKDLVYQETVLNVGDRVGPYQIDGVIGDGGMGIVYLGHRADKQFEQRVAIKFSRHSLQNDQLAAQLMLERQLLGRLDHPNIARIFDAGVSADKHPFLIMEYVDGVAIDCYCDQHELSLNQRLQLLGKVCHAVQYAHQQGIIHRDIKPANVLVTEVNGEAFPKVIDFGIAQTRGDSAASQAPSSGTPLYMSPEQFVENTISTQSDVYSLGLLAYRIICGALPFDREGDIRGQKQQPIMAPRQFIQTNDKSLENSSHGGSKIVIEPDLDAVIGKACANNPGERYQTASEFAEDILRYQQHFPVNALPHSSAYWIKKLVRRHRYSVAAAALVIVSLFAATVVSTNALLQEQRARAQAQVEAQKVQAVNGFLLDMIGAVDPREGGLQVKVVDMLDQAEADVDARFAEQPLIQASVYSTLGETRQGLGQYQRADTLLQRALDIYRQQLGENHLDTVAALNRYGENLASLSGAEQALPVFQQALTTARRELGAEHRLTMSLINNVSVNSYLLAQDSGDQTMQQKALALMRELLTLRSDVLGVRDENTSHARNNLATMLERTGELESATALYRENLAIQTEVFGVKNYYTLATMSNLANVLSAQNQFAEAEQLARASVEGLTEIQGANHNLTQRSRMVLLEVLVRRDALNAAEVVLADLKPYLDEDPSRIDWLHADVAAFYRQVSE